MTTELLQHADPAVRPQDDLFRHVNGGWLRSAEIPADQFAAGVSYDLRDRAEEAVHAIITDAQAAAGSGDEVASDESVRIASLFASFADTDTAEQRGIAPLVPLLEQAERIVDAASLARWCGWATRRGIDGLFSLSVEADPGDPNRVVLFCSQSGLGLPDEAYYREAEFAEIRTAYHDHLRAMLTLLESSDPEAEAWQVLAVESAIASRHWDKVRTRDLRQMYNPQSFDELSAASAGFDWSSVLDAGELPSSAFATVVNAQPSYFASLGDLVTSLPIESWRAWARWQTTHAFAGYLDQRFVDADFAFYGTTLAGTQSLKERWKRGVELVEGSIGEDLGKLYVERHFPPAAKQRVADLVQNLLQAYRDSITELDWMTDTTRAEALRKLSKFRPKIGYPERWKDYSGLQFDPTDLVGNVLAARSWKLDDELTKISRPTDRDEWFMTPQTVNAYYHPLRNEIVFPAAILQPPFFDVNADDALNYGGIGSIIGHEIGHGFDDQGSACDGDGVLRNWWSDADRAAFDDRTRVLIDQYGELSPEGADGQRVNGELTIGENIGDLGGLSIAFRAWQLTDAEDSEPIDGVTPAQRLFLNWAAVWRSKFRGAAVKQRLATDPHSPNEFRANQTVRNIDAFHRAFATVESDGLWLSPEQRVKIW